MNCKKYEKLIERYLTGEINAEQLAELHEHTNICERCGKTLEEIKNVEEAAQATLVSRTNSQQASAAVLENLPDLIADSIKPQLKFVRFAVAASIFLAVGLFIGFTFGRIPVEHKTRMAVVPLRVLELEGVVLARHADSKSWVQLQQNSTICLGDTFTSTAKGRVVLGFKDESRLELSENSTLALSEFNGRTEFYLEHGKLAAELESPHSPFFVSTPHGRVEALGTEFTVNVE